MHPKPTGQCFQAPLLDDNAIEVETKPSRKPNPVGELSKYANLTFDGPKRSAASSKYVAGNGDGAPEGGKKRRSREVDAPNAKEGAPAGKRVKLSTAVNLLTAGKRAAPASLQQSTKRSGTSSKGADPLQLLPEPLQQYMRSKGHAEALPIQAQCWAPLLAGSDVTAVAPPGSGKTLGYLLPAAAHVLRIGHSAATRPPGPLAVVLLPTRELAQQVAGVCQGLKRHCGLRSVCITGGVEKEEQIQALARGPHVVIATPGRLLDLEEEGHVILSELERGGRMK